MEGVVIGVIAALFVILVVASATIKIAQEYERGVIFRLGKYTGVRGPGLYVIIPFVERSVKVDLRVVTLDIPSQEAITKDNVTVKVNAVVYFRVVKPEDSVIKVYDHRYATSQISQTTMRSVIGQHELDELLSQREKLNQNLQRIIDEQTDPWGVKVSVVEIKEVELQPSMVRAIGAQAEAERERRAKIVHAEGEQQAAEKLAAAAKVIATEPMALQLRYLQTLTIIATENASTVIFPLPMDLVTPLLQAASGMQKKG
ncbi:MAG: slipin family protein [Dehalococcoidia bacterium]|nr:MAG: slipin family protein [Dehalococcoidia bacterium]